MRLLLSPTTNSLLRRHGRLVVRLGLGLLLIAGLAAVAFATFAPRSTISLPTTTGLSSLTADAIDRLLQQTVPASTPALPSSNPFVSTP